MTAARKVRAPLASTAIATRTPSVHAPAVELRRAVERDGLDVVRRLHAAAVELNREHFAGKLPPVFLMLATPSSPRALGTHEAQDRHGLRLVVKVAPCVVAADVERERTNEPVELRLARDVLLHELIHVACNVAGEPEPGYRGHGPAFAALATKIGASLGLPPVGVKGRDGLPDCAHWPLNVRPAGYYGDAIGAGGAFVGRKRRATSKRDGAADTGDERDERDGKPPANCPRRIVDELRETCERARELWARAADLLDGPAADAVRAAAQAAADALDALATIGGAS